jgi:pyocin large subunit-like protein
MHLPDLRDEALNWQQNLGELKRFRRHGPDFGASTVDDYIQQGSRFFKQSQLEKLPTKVDSKGVIRVYDPKTNTFGSFNPDGTIKTFYKPDPALHNYPTNLDYWNAQKGTAPWTP